MTDTPNTSRRGRKSGRSASRGAARGGATVNSVPYIKRQIKTYDLLREEELVKIEDTSDRILEEVGIQFMEDEDALALWKEAGADIKGDRVHFPKGLVRDIIQKNVPKTFTQYARNPERNVEIGGDNLVFAPAYGSPYVRDLEKGRRYGTLEDFENFVKLAYVNPWMHHSGGTVCEPVDIPVSHRHLDMVYAHMRYSDKPFLGSVTAPSRAQDTIDMCKILFGEESMAKNCHVIGNVNVNSPLVFDGVMTGALRTYAQANQGSIVLPFILGGAMGPVTIAGAVAQAMAEAMVGTALTQLVKPGAPVILGVFLSSMSLRTGAPTFGMPEPSIGNLAIGQLSRRLGVPLRMGGSFTASKLPDGQAMQESADALNSALLGGVNYMLHAAGWLEGGLVMSYEKFMMDADHCGMMHVMMKGMPLDDNALAMQAFLEGEPGKHFLGNSHTMANYQTAFYDSNICNNESFEQWQDAGAKDTAQIAYDRWKKALADYEAPAMEESMDEALKDFVARRKSEIPEAWY